MSGIFTKLQNYLELGCTRVLSEWREIWSKFTPRERAVYTSEVTRRREALNLPKLNEALGRAFFSELEVGFRNAAFLEAQKIAKRSSHPVRVRWIREKLEDQGLLQRMADNHSFDECIDSLLGLDERKIKAHLFKKGVLLPKSYEREDTFLKNASCELFTPYRTLKETFNELNPKRGEVIVDLGSGLGRVGAYVGLFHPGVYFKGYELVAERYLQASAMAKHLRLHHLIEFYCEDVGGKDWQIPVANYYFLFNPFSQRTLLSVVDGLLKVAHEREIQILTVQFGRPLRQLKKLSWLKEQWRSTSDPKWEGKGVTLYQSRV